MIERLPHHYYKNLVFKIDLKLCMVMLLGNLVMIKMIKIINKSNFQCFMQILICMRKH